MSTTGPDAKTASEMQMEELHIIEQNQQEFLHNYAKNPHQVGQFQSPTTLQNATTTFSQSTDYFSKIKNKTQMEDAKFQS